MNNLIFTNVKKTGVIFLCIGILQCCKKDKTSTTTTADNTTQPVATAVARDTIKGKVTQYDQSGNVYTNNLNTTTVSVEGTTITTITDITGSYQIPGISSGNYTLTFSKPGCILYKLKNISFGVKQGLKYNIDISDKPTFIFTNAYAKDTSIIGDDCFGGYFAVRVGIQPTNSFHIAVAIYGKTNELNIADSSSYTFYRIFDIPNNASTRIDYLPYCFSGFPYFQSGSTFYVRIYPLSTAAFSYNDPTTGNLVFTNYGTPYPIILSGVKH